MEVIVVSTLIIDGKQISKSLESRLAEDVKTLVSELSRTPSLVLIEVGENPESKSYLRIKRSRATKIGLDVKEIAFPANVDESTLLKCIRDLNVDRNVDGILLQLPLPEHLDAQSIIFEIDPSKDVDGLHPHNLGYLFAALPCLSPPTPQACLLLAKEGLEMLRGSQELAGLDVVVVGRSLLVGRPTAMLFTHENASVTLLHSASRDLKRHCSAADILVVACGVESLIGAEHVKNDAILIDVGMHWKSDGSIVGDVDVSAVDGVVAARTPVPGGVGPLTVTMLLRNVVEASRSHG
jgi:methylenetetrahydrofolate dehydrogenase (NADP+)/methenyltetrahydrofolate cyclohydrolase